MQYNLCFDKNSIKESYGNAALAAFLAGINDFDQTLSKSGWKTSVDQTPDVVSVRFWLNEKTSDTISERKFIKEFGGWKGKIAKLSVSLVGPEVIRNWLEARLENIKNDDVSHRDEVVVSHINGLLKFAGVTAYRGGKPMVFDKSLGPAF